MTRLVLEARNKSGNEYTGRKLKNILCGCLHHPRMSGVTDVHFLDNTDSCFYKFLQIVDRTMKDLLERGIGTEKGQADPITLDDELKLREKGVFGDSDSKSLQLNMFYFCCKFFGVRGEDEQCNLESSQFVSGEDSRGPSFSS